LLKFFFDLSAHKELLEIAKRYNFENNVEYFVYNCTAHEL